MKKMTAEEVASRLEATINVAMDEAIIALRGMDEYDAADALYKRLDERMVGQILLKVKR